VVQIDFKIPVGTENKPVGDAQKSEHSSSGGLFEMLFSGLSIPESEAGKTLHLSEEDLQSFSVLTGMGYLNSFKGLVDKTDSEDILDSETELLSSEISEEMSLFGIEMDALEPSLTGEDALEPSLTGENDDPLAGLAQIFDPLTPRGAGLGILSDGAKGSGLQQVLVSPKGLPSGLLSDTFNMPDLGQGGMNNLPGNVVGTGSSTLAGSLGGNVTMNGMSLQGDVPQLLLGENGLKPFSASDMAALTDEENPDILIRRVMDGMKNNIEFDVETYGNKPGMKNDVADLQNMLMRGTSPIANQSGQMLVMQNQALQAASQLTTAGQIETTDEARSVLRDASSGQAGSISGQTGATATGSFSGGNSGQGSLAQQNAFLPTGAQVSSKGELDLMQDKWTKKLAERIEKSLRDGQQEIDLILKPKNLGKLNLRLAINNQSLNVQIQADNQHVVSLLQDSEPRLMQMLDGSGFKSAQLAFTSGFGDAPGFGNRQNQSQQQDERIANTSQNGLVKSSEENIMVGAKSRSSDHVKTGVDVIA
jgi:hypothetical protein